MFFSGTKSPKGGPAGAGCAKTLGQRLCSGEAGGQVTRRRHDQKWVQNGLVNIHVLLVYRLYIYYIYNLCLFTIYILLFFLMFYLFSEPSMNIGEALFCNILDRLEVRSRWPG